MIELEADSGISSLRALSQGMRRVFTMKIAPSVFAHQLNCGG
jgi:hypothetical protein